jgi:hypothetical protein
MRRQVLDDLKVVGRHVRELREVTSTTGKALFHLRFASYPWPWHEMSNGLLSLEHIQQRGK